MPRLIESVIYELHVGAFTADGTFDAAIEHLDELVDLGVTAVEPMPIAAFPARETGATTGFFPSRPSTVTAVRRGSSDSSTRATGEVSP
jgi:hypothetical protein